MLSTSLLHQDLQKQLTTFGRGKKMKKYLGVILVLTTMILNILVKSYVGIGVNGVLIFLGIIALIKGFKLEEIVENGYLSGKKSLLVIKIFLLVGGISSIWIMSGTIPTVVYQGIRLMNPNYFYLSSFLITSVESVDSV